MFAVVLLSVVQGYHQLYELHRSRLETQLLHLMQERDCWIQLSFSLATKVSRKFDLLCKCPIFCVGFFRGCFIMSNFKISYVLKMK